MGAWTELLERQIAGLDDATHLRTLRLPPVLGWEPGRVWSSWEVDADFLVPTVSALFGGYVAALADQFLACAMFTVLEDAQSFATGELHVHFLRAIREGRIDIEARVVSRTRRSAYCEVLLRAPGGELLARAGATQWIHSS